VGNPKKLNGFIDNLHGILENNSITIEEFKSLSKKPLSQLTDEEKIKVRNIVHSIPMPNKGTIMQKVIPIDKLEDYTVKKYKPKGFMTRAEDSKHLSTFEDLYYGLRLDYKIDNLGTQAFNLTDGGCLVMRFEMNNPEIMICPENLASPNDFPFTNTGLTSAENNRIGTRELCTKDNEFADIKSGAIFFRDFSGNETPVAIFDPEKKFYVAL
jgi:hypothetical protein